MKPLFIILLTLMHTCIVTAQEAEGNIVKSISKLLDAYESFEMVNGVVLVAEGDKILYQKAFGKANFEWDITNHTNSRFEIASISKQFTALMIMQLIDQGKLSFDSKIADVFPEYPKPGGDRITIEQLLSHTSGLIDTRHIENFDRIHGVQPVSREQLLQMFWNRDLLFEPGTKWSYSNFNYNLLAMILEHITGKDMNTLFAEKICKPCAMSSATTLEDKGIIKRMANGYELDYYTSITPALYHDPSWSVGSGHIVMTAGDYHKYFNCLNSGLLLSPGMKERFTKIYQHTDSQSGEWIAAGYGFFQDRFVHEQDTLTFPYASGNHYGVHTAAYHFYEEEKLIVIFLNLKIQPMRMFEIGDNIARILHGFPYEFPKDMYVRNFAKNIEERGVAEAIAAYRQLKSERGDQLTQRPRDFNRLGYYYLNKRRADIAVEIFKVNLENFPDNPDLMDSLGEGYMALGNNVLAIEYFEKAAARDPENQHAREMLEILRRDQ